MINKQGLWFLTLTSLILVLSVYYITMPNELLISTNGNYVKNEESKENIKETIKETDKDKTVNVSINEASIIETMQAVKEDERLSLTNELNDKLVNKELTTEEKNLVYEELKYIAKIEGLEEVIKEKIKKEYGYDSFVKIDDDVVEIIISSEKHDSNLAVKIMKSAQEEFENQMYISVSFKE